LLGIAFLIAVRIAVLFPLFPRVFTAPPRNGQNHLVHIPAKVEYGLRALLTLAAAGTPETAEHLAEEQGLPPRFLGAILSDLRRSGIVASQRGAEGGYRLARPAQDITLADVIRSLDGPLAEVRGTRPEATSYDGAAEHLAQVWVAVRASLRSVLECVTLADVVSGKFPRSVAKLTEDPDAWVPR
jgi:Rrf2 family protein